MANILVLEGHTIQSLPVMKALNKAGHKVFVECENKISYGYFSRYPDVKFIKPALKYESEEYLHYLIDLIISHSVDVVFPLFDNSAEFASKYNDVLSRHVHLLVPKYDDFLRGYNKDLLMKYCRENGVPHPKTIEISLLSCEQVSEYTGFPALIKPNISFGARGMQLVRDVDELYSFLPGILNKYGPCTLQEFIPPGGRQYMVHHFRTPEDEFLSSTVVEKVRFYPETGGSSCCNKTIEFPYIEKFTKAILRDIDWLGVAHFDLIEDPRDNVIKVMEINPRISGSIKSAFRAGVDYANIYVDYCLGNKLQKCDYKSGVYVRYVALDVLWFLTSPNRFNAMPSWFKFFGKDVCFQDGGLDDPMPFLFGALSGLKKLIGSDFRKSKSGLRKKKYE